MDEEVEIVVQPTKKIVILDCTEFPLEEFFKRVELIARTGHPVALNWAEGIVFVSMPFPHDSDFIIEEALKGTMYLASVMFSSLPKYQSIKKMGTLEIPIVDQTSIQHLRQVAQFLKTRFKN